MIEFLRGRQALFFELRLVPVAVADDDRARLGILGGAPDDREQFVKRTHVGQVDAGPAADTMEMSIGKAGRHKAALQIDDRKIFALFIERRFAHDVY